jgi:hypothetical protein
VFAFVRKYIGNDFKTVVARVAVLLTLATLLTLLPYGSNAEAAPSATGAVASAVNDGVVASVTEVNATGIRQPSSTEVTIRVANAKAGWVYAGLRAPDGRMAPIVSAYDQNGAPVSITADRLQVVVPASSTVWFVAAINQTGTAVVLANNVVRATLPVRANALSARLISTKVSGRNIVLGVATSQAFGDRGTLRAYDNGHLYYNGAAVPASNGAIASFVLRGRAVGKHTIVVWINGRKFTSIVTIR